MKTFAILLLTGLRIFSSSAQLLPPDEPWVEETLSRMSLDEKLGQLFFPVHRTVEQTTELIRRYNIGGIWFARSEATRIARELNALQQASKFPLLVTADFEKGAGTYIDGATDLPMNMALGAARDPDLVYRAAALTAREARALGVHINFAPVMDVNNNPKNPVINTRSYGEDPKLVALLAEAAVRGYQENGLLATGKHFPGHGNTDTDSHTHLGLVPSTPEEFEAIELLPYREVLQRTNLANIMSAHLWIPAVDPDTIPATLSPRAMHGLLRERLNFEGLIFTDAMDMGGITTRFPYDVAVVKALQAGCDVILFPGDVGKGITAIKAALRDGLLTLDRIDQSVRRILRSKTLVGLHRERMVAVENIPRLVGTAENYREALEVAAACLTLVKNDRRLLPIDESKTILVVSMSNREGNSMLSRALLTFPDNVATHAASVQTVRLSDAMAEEEIENALALAKAADVVVVSAFIKIVLHSGTVELPPAHTAFINRLTGVNPNVVLVSFGNPYIGASVPDVPAYVCAYDNAKALQEVAAEALFGTIPFKGKLPVTISESMEYGVGLTSR